MPWYGWVITGLSVAIVSLIVSFVDMSWIAEMPWYGWVIGALCALIILIVFVVHIAANQAANAISNVASHILLGWLHGNFGRRGGRDRK